MPRLFTRRDFLERSAAVGSAVAAASLLTPGAAFAQPAGIDSRSEDLEDIGNTFPLGSARDVTIQGGVLRSTSRGGVFTSRVLRSATPFTHLGLHWSAVVPDSTDLRFELRTSPDGVAWSAWAAVRVETLPHESSVGDFFASLVSTPGARFVQYRATFSTDAGASPSLRRVTATAIDSRPAPVGSSALATRTVTDALTGRSVTVIARQQWGANEAYRFSRKGKEIWPEQFVPFKKIVVHHTATANNYTDGAAEVRAIYRYHAVTKRWGDIGYNAIVDNGGNLYEGRHGRGEDAATREVLSAGVVAGHDLSHNYGSAGVALLGDATGLDWPMPSNSGPMWDALVRYSVFESARHFVRPLVAGKDSQAVDSDVAVADFLRSDDAWSDAMRNVSGHQETNATTCPGQPVMALLDELRTAIHNGLVGAGTLKAGVQVGSIARVANVNQSLTFSWIDQDLNGWAVDHYEYCWEGWFKPATSDDVQYLTLGSGYEASDWGSAQPRQRWQPTAAKTLMLTPLAAGHYTLHVRAVVTGFAGTARGLYEGNHTYLVN